VQVRGSSIPIGGKAEISPKGFTLGVKDELEKNLFHLPQVTEKGYESNLRGQFATLGANVSRIY
jgi:hypothetical protein